MSNEINENLKEYGINEDVIRGMVIAAKIIKQQYESSISPMTMAQCTGKRYPGKEKMKIYEERQAARKEDARLIAYYAVKLENGELANWFIQSVEND